MPGEREPKPPVSASTQAIPVPPVLRPKSNRPPVPAFPKGNVRSVTDAEGPPSVLQQPMFELSPLSGPSRITGVRAPMVMVIFQSTKLLVGDVDSVPIVPSVSIKPLAVPGFGVP